MDAVMKHLVIAIGIFALSIWRSLANLLIAGTLYLPRRLPRPSRATLKLHVGRGVIVTIMALLFFWGIGRVPLAQGIALTFIAPLIALLLAALILHEQIGPRSLGGSVLLGSAAILGSALCYAVNIVMMRRQAIAAKPLEINFFQTLTVMVLWFAVV